MKLFFDTETTGLVNFKEAPNSDCQPRLVQLAAILTDETGNELDSINTLVAPDGFEIPEEASKVHGITTEKAKANGLPIAFVMGLFCGMRSRAKTLIAHNISYDLFVMRGEMMRINRDYPDGEKEKFCTMMKSTNICKIIGPRGFKWPSLQEAYKHAFGKGFEGAHDAMNDIRATKEFYFWLIKQPGLTEQQSVPSKPSLV